MKIKVEQFCSLATSPSWQAWLYRFNDVIYRDFIHKLHESSSCVKNREIMEGTLQKIEEVGGIKHLYQFLEEKYPHVLKHNSRHLERSNKDIHGVFPGYIDNILTYPHRRIFEGPSENIEERVLHFLSKKGESDYIIIGEYAYVEYLENFEEALRNEIPNDNWLIASYRKNNT